jgi:hypothetical protein
MGSSLSLEPVREKCALSRIVFGSWFPATVKLSLEISCGTFCNSFGSPRLEQDARNPTLINYDQYLNEQLEFFVSILRANFFSAFFNWRITLKNSMSSWQADSIWSTFFLLTETNTFNRRPQWLSLIILFGELYLSSMDCPHTHHTSYFRNFFFGGPTQILSRFNMIVKISLRLVEE